LSLKAEELRLQVFLARGGVASRRGAEELIRAGRVRVNGVPVTVMGTKVLPTDRVEVDGRPVRPGQAAGRYLALHKPAGFICSAADPEGRPRALDLLPQVEGERLFSVGRLDFRSSGLLLFTNDGEFAARVGHPRAGIEKEYVVEASAHIPDLVLEDFCRGVYIEGTLFKAEALERLGSRVMRVVLVEGKNREIRRVFSHFHLHPRRLHRVRIGPVVLGDLAPGASRDLTEQEKQTFF